MEKQIIDLIIEGIKVTCYLLIGFLCGLIIAPNLNIVHILSILRNI